MFQPGESEHRDCHYTVTLNGHSKHLVVTVGHTYQHSGWRFSHPNVVATHLRIMSFRRYLPSGAKRWIEKAGIERTFVIPLERIELDLPTSGYSYVGVRINGVCVKLNVSGGTLGLGWQDLIGQTAAVLVNYPQRVVRALADAAYSPEECRTHAITTDVAPEGASARSSIQQLMADQLGIRGLVPGETVFLRSSVHVGGATRVSGTFLGRCGPGARRLRVRMGDDVVQVKPAHIDWVQTLSSNGRMPPVPTEFNHCPDSKLQTAA